MGGKFYVYEHWRPDTQTCFYVGKGSGLRSHDFRRGRNRRHKFIVEALKAAGFSVDVRFVVADVSEEEAFSVEIQKIAYWRALGASLCNATEGGDGPSGAKHSDEWKQAMSKRMTGRPVSEDAKRKIALSAIGNKRGLGTKKSAESVERTAAAHRGVKRSAETRARISAAKKGKPGHKLSNEQIEIIRAANTGKKRSQETRERMRKPKSAEHRAKLSAANLGKSHSSETRAKLSELARIQWASRKFSQISVGG